MSRIRRQMNRRLTAWPIFCGLAFGMIVLAAPSADARRLPDRPSGRPPSLQSVAVDNEGPVAMMPIRYARRPARETAVRPEWFDLLTRRPIMGPPPPEVGKKKTAPVIVGPPPRE